MGISNTWVLAGPQLMTVTLLNYVRYYCRFRTGKWPCCACACRHASDHDGALRPALTFYDRGTTYSKHTGAGTHTCARPTSCAAACHARPSPLGRMRPRRYGGASALPRASLAAADGRRRLPRTRRGSAASPVPASTSRGRMSRRKGERRGQTWACARALWAGRARSSARRTVAAAAAAGR